MRGCDLWHSDPARRGPVRLPGGLGARWSHLAVSRPWATGQAGPPARSAVLPPSPGASTLPCAAPFPLAMPSPPPQRQRPHGVRVGPTRNPMASSWLWRGTVAAAGRPNQGRWLRVQARGDLLSSQLDDRDTAMPTEFGGSMPPAALRGRTPTRWERVHGSWAEREGRGRGFCGACEACALRWTFPGRALASHSSHSAVIPLDCPGESESLSGASHSAAASHSAERVTPLSLRWTVPGSALAAAGVRITQHVQRPPHVLYVPKP